MRRILTLLRRTVALIALSTFVLTLVWLVRTWERGDQVRVRYERHIQFDDTAVAREISFAIGSRNGQIGIDFVDGTGSEREGEPYGWWSEHIRTDMTNAAWTLPGPLDDQLADHFDLIVDGLWPPLHDRGIGLRLYIADHDAWSGPTIRSNAFWTRFLLPHWLVAILAAMVFLLATLPDWRRRRRSAMGLCVQCGYDLRASPGRCPECGWTTRVIDEPVKATPQ